MPVKPVLRAVVIAGASVLLLAPVVLADTCCANVVVQLSAEAASPGDQVAVSGIRCLAYDNSGPLEFAPLKFNLSPGHQRANPNPGDTPGNGQGLPATLPAVEQWPDLYAASGIADGTGTALFRVPDLAKGSYQFWWWCDNGGGPGSGIHYSDGPRLTITGSPETDAVRPDASAQPVDRVLPLLLVGCCAGLGTMVVLRRRQQATGTRQQ